MLKLDRLSFGVGDRFAHQAAAQLRAFQEMASLGVNVTPVWNKSNREHSFVGSEPESVRIAAREAVEALDWRGAWHVDADHIQLETVARYLDCSDFFTIDVADAIGGNIDDATVDEFVSQHPELSGQFELPDADTTFHIDRDFVIQVARKFLPACLAAGKIYRRIAEHKGEEHFIAEVSLDETDTPQPPAELLIILAALADQKIRLQSIAPKFTGRFNKGVDYVGDVSQFRREFFSDIAVIRQAVQRYGLPENLKLSVHSGSDKFSLYPIIREALQKTGAGVHLKTAGTTWLEELIGLSEAGGDGLDLVKKIYAYAVEHVDDLCRPYASVIDINREALPGVAEVENWDGEQMAATIRHVPSDRRFNSNVRQLLHVSFKVAAAEGRRYLDLLEAHAEIVGQQVTANLLERHLKPLFIG